MSIMVNNLFFPYFFNISSAFFLVTTFLFEGSLPPIDPACPAVVWLFIFLGCEKVPVLHGRATVYPVDGRRIVLWFPACRPPRELNPEPLDRQSCTLSTRPKHRVLYDWNGCESGTAH